MIINALARYYDCLKNIPDSPLPPSGYSKVNIDYVIVLNDKGEMVNILPHTKTVTEKGKPKEVPKTEILPERISATSVKANFLEHRPVYIFGMEFDKEFCITEKSKKSFIDYQEKAKIFKEVNSPIAQALYKFSINWKPENEIANSLLTQISKSFGTAKFTYCLETDINSLAGYNESITKKWDVINDEKETDSKELGYCSVCGCYLPIAKLHDNLKGIKGGMAVGTNIVCVNNRAEESFNMEQGQVASVSTEIMKKYTAAFSALTESPYNHAYIGDVTLLFWAESDINPQEIAQSYAVANNFVEESEQTNKTVKNCLDYIRQGKPFDESSLALLDTKFYVLGVKPNASRLTIKFFYANTFGKTLENAKQHFDDLKLYEDQKTPSISRIIYETVSPNSTNKDPNPALVSGLFSAVLNGGMYPGNLLSSIVRRIRTDQDSDKSKFVKINDTRISVIKAYLTRNQRIFNKGEIITMSLNKTNVNQAYLCGRLFAVLEKLQTEAIPGVNAGIKSRYFSSACTTPAMVFPRLIMLGQTHISKLEKSGYLESILSEIMGNLNDSFPKKLDIEEQGKFILGYYQQNKDLYTKKEDR
ncbi:MAG TPA: type I-C CRISPR-associated protein Cas8c/Csd1 [Clostridia bacterium]|nr:type I-C CRISPR-associated protein Cas8c/Csd1 [Clostridia bacterium]